MLLTCVSNSNIMTHDSYTSYVSLDDVGERIFKFFITHTIFMIHHLTDGYYICLIEGSDRI